MALDRTGMTTDGTGLAADRAGTSGAGMIGAGMTGSGISGAGMTGSGISGAGITGSGTAGSVGRGWTSAGMRHGWRSLLRWPRNPLRRRNFHMRVRYRCRAEA
jgi:hypothetical protein